MLEKERDVAQGKEGVTLRVVILGSLLSALFTFVNSYLNVNFGMGLSFGVVAILMAYVVFHKILGNSSRREVALVWIISGSSLSAAWFVGFLIYLKQTVPNNGLPAWLVPSAAVIQNRVIFSIEWLIPILVILFITVTSGLLGMILAHSTYRLFVQNKRMVFPFTTSEAVIVDSCFKKKGPVRFLAYFMITGFAVTLVQYILKAFNIETTIVDLSPYLPQGFLLGMALNIAFIAIGYFISARASISILISSLASYLVISHILVNQGIVAYNPDSMNLYMDLLYQFLISPGIGMLILGGIILSLVGILATKLKLGSYDVDEPKEKESTLGYDELFRFFLSSIFGNRRLLLCFMGTATPTVVFAYYINFMHPFPPVVSIFTALFFLLATSFIDFVIITKMAGEAGMTTGTQSLFLYMLPIFATGYKGYTAYMAQPGRSDPWNGSRLVGLAKVRDIVNVDLKTLVKAMLIG